MLTLTDVEASYGQSQVLFGMSLHVGAGEVVSLMGRNGMGKTTTIRSIMGMTPARAGTIQFEDQDISAWPAFKIAKAGIGLVPEGRQVFPNLSVRENLIATARQPANGAALWTESKIFEMFPKLAERAGNMGNQLSGGEQQMLAVGRALMTNPRLLILDEATEGLAPLIRAEIWQCLENLKREGQSILIIDKSIKALTQIGDRHNIVEKGRVVWTGNSDELQSNTDVQHKYLGI